MHEYSKLMVLLVKWFMYEAEQNYCLVCFSVCILGEGEGVKVGCKT